ncbi:MAG: hypothetical protein IKN68_03350 [Spirochaetia bacterium]|nr:hypothetical protein [Spirochaetia bacterium]
MEDGKSIIWQIQKEILGSPPLNIADNPLAKLEGDEQREEAMDGRNVFFNNTGYKELKYHSANPTTLQLIPKLREIIRSAILIFSEENEDKSKPNIKAYHNDGTIFYDGEVTELKKVQELQNQPYRTPIAGEELSAPSNNKLLRFFAPVNNNSWRQV